MMSVSQHTIFQYRKSSSRRLFREKKTTMKQKRGNPHPGLSRKSSMSARSLLLQKYLVESPIYLMTHTERERRRAGDTEGENGSFGL